MTPEDQILKQAIKQQLQVDHQEAIEAYRKRSADDFLLFVRGLRIQVGGSPEGGLFSSVAADFQIQCFKAITPHIEALRNGDKPDKRRIWIERTKKASKDADLAAIVSWLCAFPVRPFFGEIGAADSAQASIIHQRVSALLEYNKWLLDYVELINSPFQIRSKKKRGDGRSVAVIDILASDTTGGAHGSTPDLLILNELTHTKKWAFVEDCLTNAAGVPDGVVIIATNAGYKGTKAEMMRDNARSQASWLYFAYSQPAPWHDKETIKEERRRLGESAFRRLWEGQWVSGKGDALNEDDVTACFCLNGPTAAPEDGWEYVGGLDLGVSNDHSALVILGVNHKLRKIKTAWWRAWAPSPKTGEVLLQDVQNACLAMSQHFRCQAIYYDPTEAKLMAQQLKNQIVMREMSFSKPSNLMSMASTLIQTVEDKVLQCYDDEEGTLRRDFGKFTIEEKPYGFKLEAVRDEYGHADVGTALVIALPYAVEIMGGFANRLQPDDVIVWDDDKPMTQQEMDEMPQEFKDLFAMEDHWASHTGYDDDFQDEKWYDY